MDCHGEEWGLKWKDNRFLKFELGGETLRNTIHETKLVISI